MTRLTAMIIQGNDVLCQAGGPSKDNGKYVGWITKCQDGSHPLLNTEPVYDTEDAAISAMEEIVSKVKALDLNNL